MSNIQNKIKLNKPHDYLKYWRVIRYFMKRKYGLSTADLDFILFLYQEERFSKDKFREFDKLLKWDVKRFERLRKDGWITVFRIKRGNRKALYEISHRGKRVADSIYKKLSGEEIPETRNGNPMFKKNVGFSDKVYRNMIIEMNAATRQRRHQAPES